MSKVETKNGVQTVGCRLMLGGEINSIRLLNKDGESLVFSANYFGQETIDSVVLELSAKPLSGKLCDAVHDEVGEFEEVALRQLSELSMLAAIRRAMR